ncbi:carboxymuconolactone decarboxylase family protein [Nocardioides carbamazepini]|jgi:4-carboxymuconolactone decarboxylase|uniref:carboxymuconolactone decarboxylase family protein n=1 Tax=Nocardioides carbamazepini TaxID=2854259 RepID=UPI00214A3EED|nr:carboxymuconolactone decarboxylase family protein [Nocardioides carbamazepini]MCR1781093.1 carboxymuconolactone decarboxylase family protein [Nocardioides carbamazepini]
MSDRLARLTPDQLDEAQRAVYDSIAGGDRAKGVQHFPLAADDGSLNGPFGIMLHAPGVGAVLSELGATIRFRTDLTLRVREIVILQVAQALGSEFEWWAHERVGRAAGLTDEELMLLSLGSFRSDDPVEAAAAAFCANLLSSSVVTDDEFASASAVLSAQQLIDLTVLVGYYRTLAQLMAVFDVGIPAGETTPLSGHRHPH